MRRKHTRLLLGLILCIMVGLGNISLFAEDRDNGYKISDYKITMNVHEDSSVSITEEITAHFNEQRHGILRDIPNKISLRLKDEEEKLRSYKYKAKLTDIQVVGAPYMVSLNDGYTTIKIGDEDKMVEGDVHYTISYIYNLGDDRIRSYDMFYFNIIGAIWNTDIDKVDFKINFDKDLDLSKLELHRGKRGTVGGDVTYEIGHNEVTGTALNLAPYEAVTMKVVMPEGYYVGYKKFSMTRIWIVVGLQVILLGYILFKLLKQKNRKIIETVEFYPPDNISSAEIGYILNGKVTNKELLSLFLWLASKGYMKIESKQKGEMIFSKGDKIPTDEPEYIRLMYEAIFLDRESGWIKRSRKNKEYMQHMQDKKGKKSKQSKQYRQDIEDMEDTQDRISSNELGEVFYKRLGDIRANLIADFHGDRELEGSDEGDWIKFIIAPLLMAVGIVMCVRNLDTDIYYMATIGIIATLGVGAILNDYRMYPFNNKNLKRILGIGALIIVLVFNFMIVISEAGEILPSYIPGIVIYIGVISVVLTGLLYRRTPYKTQVLGKILGLKNFIKTAELERINALVEENPSYFYDVLPYAYVLGLTDKWIRQFETIKLGAPDWYDGDVNDFSTMYMIDEMDYAYEQTERETSRYGDGSSSSGSSDSDSSSGDGAGGGGGSSW